MQKNSNTAEVAKAIEVLSCSAHFQRKTIRLTALGMRSLDAASGRAGATQTSIALSGFATGKPL
jgi:hypothetical protein